MRLFCGTGKRQVAEHGLSVSFEIWGSITTLLRPSCVSMLERGSSRRALVIDLFIGHFLDPLVVINGEVKCVGRIPKQSEVEE